MKVEKTKPGITHVLAACRDCTATWDNYRTADAAARRHVEQTGHRVAIECAQAWSYQPAP